MDNPPRELEVAEITVLSVCGFFLLLQLITVIYVLANRHYAPFKAKQVDLILASVVCEVLWFVGLLQSIKFLPEVGAFAICMIWHLWLGVVFGFFMWVSILAVRFSKLFLIFRLKKKWPNWKMNLLFFAFWWPSLVFAVVGSVLSDQIFSADPLQNTICSMSNTFLFAMYAYAALFILLFVFFLVTLRNLKHSAFNEFTENVRAAGVFLLCYVVFTVLTALGYNGQYVWARCVSFASIQVLHNFNFWNLLAKPVFKALRDKEGAEKEFKDQVARDSLDIVKQKTISLKIETA